MRIYTSCFIGVPLPSSAIVEYQTLQSQLRELLPEIDPANPNTPHMTLYYLDSQKEESLDEIMETAMEFTHLLQGETLEVKGFDYFRPKDPRVLFLSVHHSPNVEQYYRVLTEALSSFRREQETRDFHAHVTVGRLRDDEAKEAFLRKESAVKALIEKFSWNFTIDEICMFGVDSSDTQTGQQILKKINL